MEKIKINWRLAMTMENLIEQISTDVLYEKLYQYAESCCAVIGVE